MQKCSIMESYDGYCNIGLVTTDEYRATVEVDDVCCSLEVLDTAGQEVCVFIYFDSISVTFAHLNISCK